VEHVPKVRKVPARPELCAVLRDAGLGHLETLLYPASEPSSPVEPFLMRRSTVVLSDIEVPASPVDGRDAARLPEEPTDSQEQEQLWTPPVAPRGSTGEGSLSDSESQGGEGDAQTSEGSHGVDTHGSERSSSGEAHGSDASSAIWRWKVALRSHLDAVRGVTCDEDVLLSCGEDATIKAWDMSVFRRPDLDLRQLEDTEPYATYRGHAGAVLALARNPEESVFFSAGRDATVRAWRMLAALDHDLYEPALPGTPRVSDTCLRCLSGHEDAVWALCSRPRTGLLASASADGTVRLWREAAAAADAGAPGEEEPSPELRVLALPAPPPPGESVGETRGRDVPTALAWFPRSGALLLAGFMSSMCAVFDVERGCVLRSVATAPAAGARSAGAATAMACHPALDLAVAGHADGRAQVFCASTGQATLTLEGHGAAVSALAADPRGGFGVATGSHDGALRLFDIRTGGCLWTAHIHQRKFDEAVNCVVHSGDRLVTAGADANIVMLSLME